MNGSLCQSCPSTGTTSVCPDRTTPPWVVPSAAGDRGEQVGLGPVLVGQDLRREAVPSHLGGDEVDELEVGVAARRVEGDEPGDPVQGADLRS